MAVSKKNNAKKKQSYISVPSQIINSISSSSLHSLLHSSPKKKPSRFLIARFPTLCFLTLFLFAFLGILEFVFNPQTPLSPHLCATSLPNASISNGHRSKSELGALSSEKRKKPGENGEKIWGFSWENGGLEFWKQPDGMGYRPCVEFSKEYKRESEGIVKERRKYLMVVVAGGLNQQRNQIVDAVVIARILGAALVVPILQVNVIWGDER